MKKCRFTSFFVSTVAVLSSAATSTGQSVHPAQDDPVLYSSFSFFMENFSAWLDARTAAVPASQTKLTQSAARYLNIDPSELTTVTTICKSLAATLRQINATAHTYYQTAISNNQVPSAAALAAYEAQRQTAIQSTISQLQQELTAADWASLHAHINGGHRQSITLFNPAPAQPPAASQP
jgi:hypothetical protein